MREVAIVGLCLIRYIAISSEVLAFFRGSGAVPRFARIGLVPVTSGKGLGRLVRGTLGAAFAGMVPTAIVLMVIEPSEPRSPSSTLVLWSELALTLAWAAFLVARAVRSPVAR